ncbi:Maturin [Sciurus carolinensis]|uniref:Maturin n=1 Tax=Sciurus carolinensis TaxID=30640 RepID=A0AA41MPD2_SCICA|nr:Maturin [Sciurus carolinensis]
MDFNADPGVSFYVLCLDNNCSSNFPVWSESKDCLPFLQLAQDYISSCCKKMLHEVLEKVFKSFRPLLGLPDADEMHLKSIVKMYRSRSHRQTTPKWGSVSSKPPRAPSGKGE